ADVGGLVGDRFDDFAELEQLDLAELLVEARVDLGLEAALALGRLSHRLFERGDDLLGVEPLVLRDLIDLAFQTEHWIASRAIARVPVSAPGSSSWDARSRRP